MDWFAANTAPRRATHCDGLTPSSLAPASIRAMRPAAPARLKTGKSSHTDLLPPVLMTPHFGSVSTAEMRTLPQSTSSSSARMRAMAVPMCWPISARMMLTVTMPLRSRLYQIVGSKGSDPCSSAAPSFGVNPKVTAAPANPTRKLRRESALSCSSLLIGGHLPEFGGRLFDGVADADIGHATAKVPGHDGIDVSIGR